VKTMQTLNRQPQQLETPAGTSLACGTVPESFKGKSVSQLRRENTPQGGPHVGHKHTVFVLSKDGQPTNFVTRRSAFTRRLKSAVPCA